MMRRNAMVPLAAAVCSQWKSARAERALAEPQTAASQPVAPTILLLFFAGWTSCFAAADLNWNTVDGGGGTFSSSGTVTLGGTIGQPDAGVSNAGTVTLVGGFWAHANFAPLNASSGPTVSPNPLVAGSAGIFDSGSADVGAIVSWDFGDGSAAVNGKKVTHTYAAAGNFTVKVAILQPGTGETKNQTLNVTVNPAGSVVNAPNDSDGDGVPDEEEIVLGSDPLNPNSVPAVLGPTAGPVTILPLTVTSLSIKLNLVKASSDRISLAGTLPIAAGFTALNQEIVVDVGGVIRDFTLTSKGAQKLGNDSIKLTYKSKKGVVSADETAKFQVKLNRGNFAANLTDEGLTGATTVKKDASKIVRVNVIFTQKYFRKDQAQIYSAVEKKTVSTVSPR